MIIDQTAVLIQRLELLDNSYDPVLRLLRVPYSPHKFLKRFKGWPLHPTRNSIQYALGLLDTGDEDFCQRGIQIIEKVATLQIQAKDSKYCGIWPKYWEEKVLGIYRIDLNWANFIGTYFLEVVLLHQDKLPSKLVSQCRDVILNAARSIQKRNVLPEYTNIAISGTYVSLLAGQVYGESSLLSYGIELLHKFYDHTFNQGTFTEYNSPTYQIITLKTLARLLRDVKITSVRELISDLYYLAWQGIAHHFHPPTAQWSGPHRRSYQPLLSPEALALIDCSLSSSSNFNYSCSNSDLNEICDGLDLIRLTTQCPPDLEHFFYRKLNDSQTLVETTLNKGEKLFHTTYFTPRFSLGTSSQSDCWHQRHALIAYWKQSELPQYLRLRFLADNKDFSVAQFSCKQDQGNLLAAINFATNVHAENPYHGRHQIKKRQFRVETLCLRFELGKFSLLKNLYKPDNLEIPLTFETGDLYFSIQMLPLGFDHASVAWKIVQEQAIYYLDFMISAKPRQKINLLRLEQAAIGIALKISDQETPHHIISYSHANSILNMKWQSMQLKVLTRPTERHLLNPSLYCDPNDRLENSMTTQGSHS